MAFFDLNIPYTESTKRNSTTDRSTRLKLAVKAMELGYTGVAYNHTITGVMSETDRCSISLFPLSSVLKVSPSISTAVNLHRRCLNVPTSTPFRQYTRLTVVVDTPAQGAALNSGNPVLKTYDIVAVRPLKQESFDQACKNYEVDIIAIDFSETRFRLKQPLIKAAIERGVYFEITYSGLLMDAQLRRQMISNAKLLVDWTRGKNLIFSSAAPSVNEIRGPYDVANLACLLGFSLERAKASVSKTCRSLLENSLRKKKFFKEAIKVELITSPEKTDSFDDWLKWDPLSSGEGDLQLDDMAKSFADSNKDSKTVKAIDFVSIINELPSHGLHINSESDINLHKKGSFGDCESSLADETCDMIVDEEIKVPIESNVCVSCPEVEQKAEVNEVIKVSDEKRSENVFSDILMAGITNCFDDNPFRVNIQCEEANNVSASPPMSASNEAEILKTEHTNDTEDDVAVTPVNTSCNELIPQQHFAENVSVIPLISESDDVLQKIGDNHEPLENGSMEVKVEVKDDVAVTPVTASFNELISEQHLAENISVIPLRSESDDELQKIGDNQEPLESGSMEVKVEVKDDSQTNNTYTHFKKFSKLYKRNLSFPFKRLIKSSHLKKFRKHRTKSPILSLNDLIG